MSHLIIEVKEGKLKGEECKTAKNGVYFSFKTIPYAKPPVGELRFSVPQPPEPWHGVRDATVDCPMASQVDKKTGNFVGQEDCLYLNVYTPKLRSSESKLLPVMVFIHGGGFVCGQGTDPKINGPEFLTEKDVVVVCINYRLNIFGFLSLDIKEAPGNMGLRDQVQALKWVKQNIEKFNGDPDNVTIFGESAGGASVQYLILSPTAKGLFHKAIAQSGSPLCSWAQSSKVKEIASKIPALDGKSISDDELLNYLKSLSTSELLQLSDMASTQQTFKGVFTLGFVPSIEKPTDWEPFLDKPTYDMLSKGEFTKVPLMTGFANREGLLMVAFGGPIYKKVAEDKMFVETLPFVLNDSEEKDLEKKLKKIYLKSKHEFKDPDAFAIDYFSDVFITGGVYTAASLIAKKNTSPVYFYEFAYDGSKNAVKSEFKIKRDGACHCDDQGYIFRNSKLPQPPYNGTDKMVLERMTLLLTNFAKYGNPTPNTDNTLTLKWDQVTGDLMRCLVISDKMTMKDDVYPERMKLFQKLYRNYRGSE